MNGPLIECQAVAMRFGQQPVLEDVHFKVQKGEALALLGHNGAGKSTLLRIMCGIMRPQKGGCFIDGSRVDKNRVRLSTLIGYVPDRTILYHERTVLQNLLFHATIRNSSGEVLSQQISSALVETNTSRIRDRRVGELSAGWRKMAQLACAIVHRPRVLLLDEPSAGLDWAARNRLSQIVRKLKDNAASVVIATQEAREALECDRVIILAGGRIAAEGAKDSLAPRSGYELPVVVKVAGSQGGLSRVTAHVNVLAAFDSPPDTRIVFRDEHTARGTMRDLGISEPGFSIVPASLEETYVGLTAFCQRSLEQEGLGMQENPQRC